MIRGRFNLLAACSMLLFIATVCLWIWSVWVPTATWTASTLTPDGYPLGHRVRILAYKGEVSLYNQSLPYQGGAIGVSSVRSRSPWPHESGFDFPGVYFRHFTWPGMFPGGTYWTLTFSLLWPLFLTAIAPLAWTGQHVRNGERVKRGACPRCGYDLRASCGQCPECGTPIQTGK